MRTLAIVATHPIQYYVPIYRALTAMGKIDVRVFYGKIPSPQEQGRDFNTAFQWDIDLQSGYAFQDDAAGSKELFEGIEQRRWTAVMVHGWDAPLYRNVLLRAWWNEVPILVRGDSHLQTTRADWKRWVKLPLYRRLLTKFSACLAVGTWNAQYYRHYRVSSHRIVISPHAVDNLRFQTQASEWRANRQQLRREWGMDDADFVFLFSGKLMRGKHVDDLIQALAMVKQKRPDLRPHLLIVGEGVERERLMRLALEKNVVTTLAGFLNQSQIPMAYVAADCLVLPSHDETWGMVVNEALACGTPCIVSDKVGCAVDMILSGVNGLVYPCGNIPRLAERLEAVATGELRFHCEDERVVELLRKFSPERAAAGILRGMDLCRN